MKILLLNLVFILCENFCLSQESSIINIQNYNNINNALIDLRKYNGQENACLSGITQSLKIKLQETLGNEKYNIFSSKGGIIKMNISVDSLGMITALRHCKYEGISKNDFEVFFDRISKDIIFCLFSSEYFMTQEQFIRAGNNRFGYTLFVK